MVLSCVCVGIVWEELVNKVFFDERFLFFFFALHLFYVRKILKIPFVFVVVVPCKQPL